MTSTRTTLGMLFLLGGVFLACAENSLIDYKLKDLSCEVLTNSNETTSKAGALFAKNADAIRCDNQEREKLNVYEIRIKLNNEKQNTDSIKLVGRIPTEPAFDPVSQDLQVSLGYWELKVPAGSTWKEKQDKISYIEQSNTGKVQVVLNSETGDLLVNVGKATISEEIAQEGICFRVKVVYGDNSFHNEIDVDEKTNWKGDSFTHTEGFSVNINKLIATRFSKEYGIKEGYSVKISGTGLTDPFSVGYNESVSPTIILDQTQWEFKSVTTSKNNKFIYKVKDSSSSQLLILDFDKGLFSFTAQDKDSDQALGIPRSGDLTLNLNFTRDAETKDSVIKITPAMKSSLSYKKTNKKKKQKYEFAGKYTPEVLLLERKAKKFIKEYLKWEHKYFKIARLLGIAMDGWDISYKTLKPLKRREHTASSKEALDLMVLTRVLSGNEYALQLASEKGNLLEARESVLTILREKIKSYKQYNEDYPGYGGFLTWIKVNTKVEPTDDWNDRVPALDNGEWIWGIYALYHTLENIGELTLAEEYKTYFTMLCKNAPIIFYDPELKKVRAEVKIKDIHSTDIVASNYSNNIDDYFLDDVHEGLLFLYVLSLFSDLDESVLEHIWNDVKFEKIETAYGTMYKAWPEAAAPVGSPHIKWTRIMVPELDNAMAMKISENQEVGRSNLFSYGFPVSTNTPGAIGYTTYDPNVIAPYGTYSMIFQFVFKGKLLVGNFGLAWLQNTLNVDKMQGPKGSGESFSIKKGTNKLKDISFLLTADGKMLIWCAIIGGIVDEVREALKKDGLYEKFTAIVEKEYAETFINVEQITSKGEYQLPAGPVEGNWNPPEPVPSDDDVTILGFGDDKGCWKYQEGEGAETWGEFTKPTFYYDHVLIKFIEKDAAGGWGWAGASMTCKLTPVEGAYILIKGTGSFRLKLEGDGTGGKPFLTNVNLVDPTLWMKIPLTNPTNQAFSVLILDMIFHNVTLYGMIYSPGEKKTKKFK